MKGGKVSVILAHPDQKSFNHAIAQTVVERSLKETGVNVFPVICTPRTSILCLALKKSAKDAFCLPR